MLKNKIIYALVCALLCSALVGCATPKEDFIERNETEEEVLAVQEEENAELLAKYNTHKENSELAFKTYSENPATDFEYNEVDGKICITKYIGKSEIVKVPAKILEKDVTEIGAGAFAGLSVKAVYIGDNVEKMGFGVFSGCSAMTTLRIPFVGNGDDIDNGGYIFGAEKYDENGLHVPGSLTMILIGDKQTRIEENAFYGFKSVEAFVLPKTLVAIDEFGFYDCRSLVYINMPEHLESIGEYAFMNCQSLYIIEMPQSLEIIGLGAFTDCSQIKHMTLSFIGHTKSEHRFFGYIFGAEKVEFNESFVPQSLTHITLLGTCESVPISAFESCTSIFSVKILDGITLIDIGAFDGCKSLTKVSIGASVTRISEEAFAWCKSLKKLTFEENSKLEKICMQAFMSCEALPELNLPDSVKHIENSAFYNCLSLKSVSANGIESVAKSAFRNCNAIESVTGIKKDCVTEEGNSALIAAIK